MNWRALYTVFKAMFREEWRLQNAIFSGTEFGYFPIAIMFLGAITGVAVGAVGIDIAALLVGTTILAFALGLQAGSLGFESTDSLDALLGDITPILYTTRTHPLDPRTAVIIFIVKDILYYTFLFLLPVTVGLLTGSIGVTIALGNSLPILSIAGLTLNAIGMQILLFALGTGVALAASSAVAESLGRLIAALLVIGVAVAASQTQTITVPSVQFPFSPWAFMLVAAATIGLTGIGIARFSPTRRTTTTVADSTFNIIYDWLPQNENTVLLARHIADVRRTTGGLWKTVFSAGLVLTATSLVFIAMRRFLPLNPSLPVLLAAFTSVAIVPTYLWAMQVDTPATYAHEPVSRRQLLRTKLGTVAVIHLPVLLLYVGLSALLRGSADAVLFGVGLFVLLSVYFLGITAFLTGFEPGVGLFEPKTFSAFSVLGMLVLLPIISVGLFPTAFPILAAAALAAFSATCGLYGMYRALSRWS